MSRRVVVVEPGSGQRLGNVEFLARSVDTPYFNLGIVTLAPGQGVPAHAHTDEDDSFLVLEGTLSVTVGDEPRVLSVAAGTFVLVPSGTRHEFVNASDTDVRMLNIHAPGGFDRRLGLVESVHADTSCGQPSSSSTTPPSASSKPAAARASR